MSTKMSPLQRVNSQMKITCLDKKFFDWTKLILIGEKIDP